METKKDFSFGVIPIHKTPDNEYLFCLIRHTEGHFGFPKGHPENGETPFETALRELREESGITEISIIPDIQLMSMYSFTMHEINYDKTVTYFIGFTPTMTTTTLDDFKHEIHELVWLPYEQALEVATFDKTKKLLIEAFEIAKKYSEDR